ncbi:hypothetical protein OG978_30965 [Streptomyces sp. NBC_01591]|uniref:hypothetical protein n=1 Tax=Streptomyces sp. NBC_01591 TaxID=2975888 RepID=UPI002DD7FD3C|nr:hypothetical protein [Streptomyces sp. NBC_01591]WSD71419.1 hypothetical protein OG978_30965 [Streptomyces sp. NBC_01591]
MNDAGREIAAALDDAGTGGTEAAVALRVLGRAFRWAASALAEVEDGAGGAHALAALYDLDEALEESRALADALPALLVAAMPGDQVGGGTEALMRQLAEVADRVESERAALEKLVATEEALRSRLARHGALRRQVDELRRLERLVLALDALQEQQQVIADRLADLRGRDAGVDEALRTSSDALVRLSEDRLAALAPQTRQILERAAAAQRALAAEEREHDEGAAELALFEERLEQIRDACGARVASLQKYAAVDRDLARALGALPEAPAGTATARQRLSLAEVEAAMADIESRLRAADEALRQVLTEREAQERDGRFTVPWAG